jgi:hypothetical protein
MQRECACARLCALLSSDLPRALACDLRIYAELGIYACAHAQSWSISVIIGFCFDLFNVVNATINEL